MAGRREQQKVARRRRILRTAALLFSTRGFAATSIGDIARRARLADGTLYNYFPSKLEIALAIVREATGEALSDGESLVKRPDADPITAVGALIDVYLDTFSHFERDLWRELVAGAMTDPARLGAAFFAQDARLLRQLDTLLQELGVRGDLGTVVDPGRGAIALYAVYLTWFMAYLANDAIGLESLRAQVRDGIEVVMHGLLRPAGPAGRAQRKDSP